MIELPNIPGKLNFIIDIHANYDAHLTGGIVALHRLAYEIANYGHNAIIFTKPHYPHPNIITIQSELLSTSGFINAYQWENFGYMTNNTIAVYPQITGGNHFNCTNVARWILYDTQRLIEDSYGPNDVLFNFMNFKTYNKPAEQKLTLLDYNLDRLYITNTGKRNGFCHLFHKNTPPGGDSFVNQISSFDLKDWKTKGNFDYLREHLNQYEYMLTYDQNSFYAVAAGLCGCKTIILNPGEPYEFTENAAVDDPNKITITPEKFRERSRLQRFGIAYGWNDIHWANSTIHAVRDHIIDCKNEDQLTIYQFIKYWENKLQ